MLQMEHLNLLRSRVLEVQRHFLQPSYSARQSRQKGF